MLKNYIKITFRNLWKTKGYSFLNIFGLALGIAVASLIFLWIEDEVNYDSIFENRERIYSIKNVQTYEGRTYVFSSNPGPLVPGLKEDFPEVEYATRSSWPQPTLFSLGEKTIFENGTFVDPDFIEIFSLEFTEGHSENALSQPEQVVISESMARRFFNRTNVVGETIRVDAETSLTVSGVFRDLPSNVSLSFDWLRPYQVYFNQNSWLEQWGSNALQNYVQLKPGADLASVNEKIYDFIPKKSGNDAYGSRLRLYPMERWHLYNAFDRDGNEIEGSIKYVRLFSMVAWIVLIIACINFMNLATARSQKRAKEIGVKKVVGAGRGGLIRQFISESILLSFLAGLLAIVLAALLLPYFNQVVSKELTLGLLEPAHLLFLLAIILATGVVAGSYPAFYLSSFEPIGVLKGLAVRTGGANFIRRGLVVLQFAASITLVVCTMLIYMQIQHAKNKDLGYDRAGLVTTTVYPKISTHFQAIKQELSAQGLIENAGMSDHNILGLGSNTGDFFWQGKDPNLEVLITVDDANGEYFETLGLKMLAGRPFRQDIQADSLSVIINKSLATLMGIADDPIGKTISRSWADFTIIGMVDEFMISNIHTSGEPMIFSPLLDQGNVMTVRLAGNQNLQVTMEEIGAVFKKFNPEYPFEYRFVDERFDQLFRTEALMGNLSRIFAVMAILISCLGLFGLAAYTAERRTKEIGIRKVLGASVLGLTNMLSREFVILVSVACLIAFPLSYWMMENWLSDYSYRIAIPWWVFLAAGATALIIALMTVSSQAIRAAVANPVNALRDE